MKNKQAIEKRIEHVVVDWSSYLVLALVHGLKYFITAMWETKQQKVHIYL